MDEIKASPRSRISGAIADALIATKRTADRVDVPVIGKLGQAFLGNVPEEMDNWSYGNAPFAMPPSGTGGYIPITKTGRAQNIADTLTMGLPMAGTALKGAAKVADVASTAAVRKILGNSTVTPTQVMDIAGSLMPSPVIKQTGNLAKSTNYPDEFASLVKKGIGGLPESKTWDHAGNIYADMSARVRPLTNGDYISVVNVPWGRKNKPFYAIGDDPEELAQYALDRLTRSDKAIKGASDNTLLGKLKKQFGDDAFQLAKSTQSKSEYITHIPSGTKIRISDHDLPLHYEQPDVDLRTTMTKGEQLAEIIKALSVNE